MGNNKYGIKIKIPAIYECRLTHNTEIKLNNKPIINKPDFAVLQIIDLLKQNEYNIELNYLLAHGIVRKWWCNDDIIKFALGDFVFDNFSKRFVEKIKVEEKKAMETDVNNNGWQD